MLAVLHEHNVLQSINPPSYCKAVLMPQDAFVQQADVPRQRAAARSGPACAGHHATLTRCWNCRSGEPVRLAVPRAALVCSTGARCRGRIPSVCSHVAHAVPASPASAQTSKQQRCYSHRSGLYPSAHCRRGGGCAVDETPRRSRSSGSSIQGPPARFSSLSALRGF